jgi:hypothetical protein
MCDNALFSRTYYKSLCFQLFVIRISQHTTYQCLRIRFNLHHLHALSGIDKAYTPAYMEVILQIREPYASEIFDSQITRGIEPRFALEGYESNSLLSPLRNENLDVIEHVLLRNCLVKF